MRALFIACFLFLCALSSADSLRFGSAPGQVTVIELFTSQGCSSCPPADAWLSQLKDSPELWRHVIPIAFHVDYWDRLGWPDRFGAQAHTRRQYRYREVGATRGVYTPGLVRNGREWRGWRRGEVAVGEGLPGAALSVTVDGKAVTARYDSDRNDLVFNIAVLGIGLSTDVRAGENRNRQLSEDFVVLAWHRQVSRDVQWTGQLPEVEAQPERRAVAVWVNAVGDPAPLQAAASWLNQ